MVTLKKIYKCQKVVRICKDRTPTVNDPRFSGFKNDVLDALCDLKPASFSVYMYLFTNQEGYISGLSKIDIINKTGISDGSYKNAIKELTDKGYLIYNNEFAQSEEDETITAPIYNFYARPRANFS